jgi:hypothetical protein
MASINTMANNSKDIKEEIDCLWVMGGASVMKDRNTHDIVGYCCYCDECKKKSISGNGGIAFTAEDLLVHRKMKAFKCPCGCGFHICEEFGSIIRHLDAYHPKVLEKLEKEGLDLSTKKRVWIYPDYANNSYTLTQPMPEMTGSHLENGGLILAMSKPRRVQEQVQNVKPVVASKSVLKADVAASQPVVSGSSRTWNKPEKTNISFSQVMSEQTEKAKQKEEDEEFIIPTHYAQTDMRKEKQCPNGKNCPGRDRTFVCPLNHDGNGDIIKRGTELTIEVLCRFERPNHDRCRNSRCTEGPHLEGRAIFIEQKKKQRYPSEPHENFSYSSVAGTLKNETSGNKAAMAIVTTTAQGTTITMSREDALAIANALKDLETQPQSHDEAKWNKPRNTFKKSSEKTLAKEEKSKVENNENLEDPVTFAKNAARVQLCQS